MAKSGKSAPIRLWLALATIIFLLDQLSKQLVVRSFKYGERLNIIPEFFDLTLLYNKGAAFSFLASAGGWQRWFFIGIGVVAVVFLLYLLAKHGTQRLFSFGVTLILGGAVGNVVDRIWHGHVVDFLLFYLRDWYWPAFNVADSAITVGACCLIIDELRRVRKSR